MTGTAPSDGKPHTLLFVMAYHTEREFEMFQEILDRWDDLVETQLEIRFLFVSAMSHRLRTTFAHTFLHHEDPPDTKRWTCVALEWARVAKHIETSVDCDVWIWFESDVLPVQKDAFDFLLSKWTDGCKIAGYRVRDRKWGMKKRINGVAFYTRNFWGFVEPDFNLIGTFDTRKPYFDPKTDRFVELNRWYCLLHHEEVLRLTPETRLVHGVRDRRLLEQVLGGATHYPIFPRWYREVINRLNVWRLELYRPDKYLPER